MDLLIGLFGLVSFILLISIVVVIHELGHYWAGRVCGVHAEAFSMGFGPTLLSWRDRHGTVWRVAAFPLGGYVRFLGDAGAASEPDAEKLAEMRSRMGPEAEKCFHFKPLWVRAFTTIAGPLANFILAIAIFAALGLTLGVRNAAPVVGGVLENSAAQEAGILVGDRILSINDNQIVLFDHIVRETIWRPGETLDFEIDRGGVPVLVQVTPRAEEVLDRFGGTRTFGRLGIQSNPREIVTEEYNLFQAVVYGGEQTWGIVSMTGRYIGHIVTGRTSTQLLNGPLGIMETAGQTAASSVQDGETAGEIVWIYAIRMINLAAILSVGLGLVNLLPVPILDGGHLVYYAYEAVAGRPLSMKAQEIGFRIGLALVLMMMLVATWNDINYKLSQFF